MYVKVIVPVHKPAETYELFLMAPPDRSFKKTVSHPPVHDKERGEEKRPFTPLALTLDLTPIRYIDCDAEIRWNHYDHELEYADLSLTALIDRLGGKKDTYKLNYLYEKDNFKNINLEINLNLVHGFSIGGLWEKDLELHERISNQYWLDYESQCWGVRIGAEWEDKVTSISASFRLIGLADIM